MNEAQPEFSAHGETGSHSDQNGGNGIGWLTAVAPVIVIAACGELGIGILNNSALPVYLRFGLRLDPRVMAFIMIPFFISEALFKSPLGILSDRYGRKPLMVFGTTVTIFTPLAFILVRYHQFAPFAALALLCFGGLRLLDGLGESALWPSLFAYVGDVVSEGRRARAMSVLNAVYMTGLAFSFLVGGYVDDTFGPILTGDIGFRAQMHHAAHAAARALRQSMRNGLNRFHHHVSQSVQSLGLSPAEPAIFRPAHYFPSFYLVSVLFFVASIVAISTLRDKKRTKPGDPGHIADEKISWAGFIEAIKLVPQYLLLAFVAFFGIGCLIFIVKLFIMQEYHKTEEEVGQLILIPALFIAAISYPIGHLVDTWGKTRGIRLGFVLCAVGLWGVPILHHHHTVQEASFMVSATILGVGFVMAMPAWLATVTSLSDETRRGTIFGAIATAQGFGVLLGAMVGAFLYKESHIAPFVCAAILVSIGATLSFLFIHENKASTNDPSPP